MPGLEYPDDWKFDGIGIELPHALVNELYDLVVKIADGQQSVVEVFKGCLGNPHESSDYSWSLTDLHNALETAAKNAATAVDGLWRGTLEARGKGAKVPSETYINNLLVKHHVPLRIQLPRLLHVGGDIQLVRNAETLGQQATVPSLVLHEVLGAGGYGVVHRATRETELGEFTYALKLLDPSSFVDDVEKAKVRFRREVAALGTLQHRAIVSYIEAGIATDGRPYFLMPLIAGQDLRSACVAHGIGATIGYFHEIAQALAYAHWKGILHRDLKPSNVFVRTSDSQPIILDFGAAALLEEMTSQSLTTHAVGTAGYIPSEVLADPKVRSPQQDIYACGVMLYECLMGRRPDPHSYVALTSVHPTLAAIDQVVRTAIAGAHARYAHMAQLSVALHEAAMRDDVAVVGRAE